MLSGRTLTSCKQHGNWQRTNTTRPDRKSTPGCVDHNTVPTARKTEPVWRFTVNRSNVEKNLIKIQFIVATLQMEKENVSNVRTHSGFRRAPCFLFAIDTRRPFSCYCFELERFRRRTHVQYRFYAYFEMYLSSFSLFNRHRLSTNNSRISIAINLTGVKWNVFIDLKYGFRPIKTLTLNTTNTRPCYSIYKWSPNSSRTWKTYPNELTESRICNYCKTNKCRVFSENQYDSFFI